MLQFLNISNIALIDDMQVEFESGLNLLTGETGSGKSIIVDALGVLIGLDAYVAAGTAATWIIMAVFFHISSLAALVSALFAPFFTLLLYNAAHPFFMSVCAISALLFWRHKTNIRNLLEGTEGRLGRSGR